MSRRRRPLIRALSVVVFQEGEWLCAQCLEHDLAVQAKTLKSLYHHLHRIIVGHVAVRLHHGKRPFADLARAPQKYWRMFEQSKITLPPLLISFSVKNRALEIRLPKVRVAGPVAA